MNSEEVRRAITQGHLEKVKQFVEAGKLNIEGRFLYKNTTVWHIAATGKENKQLAVLQWLLHRFRHEITTGMLNQQEENYLTPCHYAAMVGNIQALQLLVSYGADPTLTDNLHYTPRDLLKKHGYAHLAYKLNNIIAHRELLQEQVQQAEPTQLEELLHDSASTQVYKRNAVYNFLRGMQSLFSPLRNSLLKPKNKLEVLAEGEIVYKKTV